MSRETKKIKLPISKRECEVITYFTRGEKNEIQKITFEGVKLTGKNSGGEGEQEFEMNFENSIKAKDKTLELAVITLDSKSATLEDILNLPDQDVAKIEEYINNITPDEELKKNTEKG